MASFISHTHTLWSIQTIQCINCIWHHCTQRTLLHICLYFHDWLSGAETSDDQLETFQSEGLITSHVPHHHLAALSAPALLRHKLIDAQHDGDPMSIALSHNAPQLCSEDVSRHVQRPGVFPSAFLLWLYLYVQSLKFELIMWDFNHVIKHTGSCCFDINDEISFPRLSRVAENGYRTKLSLYFFTLSSCKRCYMYNLAVLHIYSNL